MSQKSIAVLTSGGDAPGMNAAVRAVVRTALNKGMQIYGVRRGFNGLLNGDIIEIGIRTVSDIIHRGGTILYTARSLEFKQEEGQRKAVETCKKVGIDGIVVIGGDGSFRGARDLSRHGIHCVGIPATIDNDIACSDYTIGFDTAVNTAVEMVDKIRDTNQSHNRCSVVEVMGRHCGALALHTGIAAGATAIIVPEVPYDIDRDIIERMAATQLTGKKHFIIIVAEGVGGTVEIAKYIENKTGIETRHTVLGHVQRGGSPSVHDRVVASRMGAYAVEILAGGGSNRVVVSRNNVITDYDITVALNMKQVFDNELYKMAHEISV